MNEMALDVMNALLASVKLVAWDEDTKRLLEVESVCLNSFGTIQLTLEKEEGQLCERCDGTGLETHETVGGRHTWKQTCWGCSGAGRVAVTKERGEGEAP